MAAVAHAHLGVAAERAVGGRQLAVELQVERVDLEIAVLVGRREGRVVERLVIEQVDAGAELNGSRFFQAAELVVHRLQLRLHLGHLGLRRRRLGRRTRVGRGRRRALGEATPHQSSIARTIAGRIIPPAPTGVERRVGELRVDDWIRKWPTAVRAGRASRIRGAGDGGRRRGERRRRAERRRRQRERGAAQRAAAASARAADERGEIARAVDVVERRQRPDGEAGAPERRDGRVARRRRAQGDVAERLGHERVQRQEVVAAVARRTDDGARAVAGGERVEGAAQVAWLEARRVGADDHDVAPAGGEGVGDGVLEPLCEARASLWHHLDVAARRAHAGVAGGAQPRVDAGGARHRQRAAQQRLVQRLDRPRRRAVDERLGAPLVARHPCKKQYEAIEAQGDRPYHPGVAAGNRRPRLGGRPGDGPDRMAFTAPIAARREGAALTRRTTRAIRESLRGRSPGCRGASGRRDEIGHARALQNARPRRRGERAAAAALARGLLKPRSCGRSSSWRCCAAGVAERRSFRSSSKRASRSPSRRRTASRSRSSRARTPACAIRCPCAAASSGSPRSRPRSATPCRRRACRGRRRTCARARRLAARARAHRRRRARARPRGHRLARRARDLAHAHRQPLPGADAGALPALGGRRRRGTPRRWCSPA